MKSAAISKLAKKNLFHDFFSPSSRSYIGLALECGLLYRRFCNMPLRLTKYVIKYDTDQTGVRTISFFTLSAYLLSQFSALIAFPI